MKKLIFCAIVLLASVASAKTVKPFDSNAVVYSFKWGEKYFIEYVDMNVNKIVPMEVSKEAYETIVFCDENEYRLIGEFEALEEDGPYEIRTENWADYANR